MSFLNRSVLSVCEEATFLISSSCFCLCSLAACSCFIFSSRSSTSTCCFCRSSLRLSRASRWGDSRPKLSCWMQLWMAETAGRETSRLAKQQLQVLFSNLDLLGCGGYRADNNTLNPFLLFLLIRGTDLKAFITALDDEQAFPSFFICHRLKKKEEDTNKGCISTWRFRSGSEPFRHHSHPGLSNPHSTLVPKNQTTNGCPLFTSTEQTWSRKISPLFSRRSSET